MVFYTNTWEVLLLEFLIALKNIFQYFAIFFIHYVSKFIIFIAL